MTVLDELCAGVCDRAVVAAGLAHLLSDRECSLVSERQFILEIDSSDAEILDRLGAQIDAILHHPSVQHLEASWRELAYFVGQVDYDNNILTEILPCTREEFDEDLNECPELTSSGLYSIIYRQAIGTYGGIPYGLLCACFSFSPRSEELATLKLCASIAAMSHAPLFTDAAPTIFDIASYTRLPERRDLSSAFLGERFATWREFRDSEDARYVGLCLPRFVLRPPHDVNRDSTMPIRYRESMDRGSRDLLWGHAAILTTLVAAGSFARYRWCVFITGSHAGTAAPLLRWDYPSFPGIWSRCPLECVITNRAERELAELGFIGLVFERTRNQATVLSATSFKGTRRPSRKGKPSDSDINEHLGGQLSYVFLVCRLAHYIKYIQQEKIGSDLDRGALERMLTKWIAKYISDMENPAPNILALRPLRSASVRVEVVPGQAGWYRCHLRIRPHLTHNNATFTLALVGKLDRRSAGGGL